MGASGSKDQEGEDMFKKAGRRERNRPTPIVPVTSSSVPVLPAVDSVGDEVPAGDDPWSAFTLMVLSSVLGWR